METAFRILILEDVASDAEMVQRKLRKAKLNFSATRVETKDAFLQALTDFAPDLILSDYSLPHFDGMSALRLAQALAPTVPFIIVTGSLTEETAVECMKAGAFDYALKESLTRLAPAIESALEKRRALTEKLHTEAALRESEERYRELFENANDIIYTQDLAGNFTSINRTGERLIGYPREQLMGANLAQLAAPEYRARAQESLNHKSLSGPEATFELEIICRDGSRLPVEVHSRLIYQGSRGSQGSQGSQGGQLVGVQGTARDISERRQAETDRLSLEEQLFQAQKMESIGTLAGGVAHDFNNLLTTIIGNTQLARTKLPPAHPVQARLAEVEQASNRAATLTRQLLAFSRRQQLERKVIDLNDTLSDFAKMLRRIIGEDVEWRMHAGEALPPVFADPLQIEQVVMNLAVNARDAMPGGGQLLIETQHIQLYEAYCRDHPWAKPGHYVQLSISDTGLGMNAETQRRIFEPFFTTKEVGKGTGLGLAMVYGIVKQHDGLIHVYSEVGHGTSFKIYLPAHHQPAASQTAEVKPALRGGHETILIAEDEEILRELAREVLTQLGYTVMLARDGKEAVEMFARHEEQIDLVLLDLVMPRLGGREAYEQIRHGSSHVPVIFMTGYSAEMARSQFVGHTGVALMQKPYTLEALGHRVREVLDQAKH